jgi:hypothetical protein
MRLALGSLGLCAAGAFPAATSVPKLANLGDWPGTDPALDTALRAYALEYATSLGFLDATALASVRSSLKLSAAEAPLPADAADNAAAAAALKMLPMIPPTVHAARPVAANCSFYVSPAGSDSAPGTAGAPLKTPAKALYLAAQAKAPGGRCDVVLQKGTHHLAATLHFGPEHSGVSLRAAPSAAPADRPVLSGGAALANLAWKPADGLAGVRNASGVLVAEVPAGVAPFMELFVDGVRATRARWPNGNSARGEVYPKSYAFGTFSGKGAGQSLSEFGKGWPTGTAAVAAAAAAAAMPSSSPDFAADDDGVPPVGTKVTCKDCRSDDDGTPFPCASYSVGGKSSERYDPPMMFYDPSDLGGGRPSGMSMQEGSGGGGGKPAASWAKPAKAIMHCLPLTGAGIVAARRKVARRLKRATSDADRARWAKRLAALDAKAASDDEDGGGGGGHGAEQVDDDGIGSEIPEWAGYMVRLASRVGNKVTFDANVTTAGFWQDQAGEIAAGDDGGFFVENVLEELDAPGEWYLDDDASPMKLYYIPHPASDADADDAAATANAATAAAGPTDVVASQLETLIAVGHSGARGSTAPVVGASVVGLVLAHSSPTYMQRYSVAASCGDWSLHEGALLTATNAQGLVVDSNLFDRPGGNAIFAHGFVGGANISRNDFAGVGDSAVLFVGRPVFTDLSGGDFPQDCFVTENHCAGNGIYGKQTSFFFEGAAGHNTVANNVAYDGPRAALNQNDGAVGGTVFRGNLIFGHGRETSDHGPFNSWSRCPFRSLRGAKPGASDFDPAEYVLERNLIINSGNLFASIVHDDGASFFTDRFNVLMFGGSQNNNAYQNAFASNLLLQPHINSNFPMPGYDGLNYDSDTGGDSATNNTIVMVGYHCNDPYGSGIAMNFGDDDSFPKSSDNKVLNDDGDYQVFTKCDPTGMGCFRNAKKQQQQQQQQQQHVHDAHAVADAGPRVRQGQQRGQGALHGGHDRHGARTARREQGVARCAPPHRRRGGGGAAAAARGGRRRRRRRIGASRERRGGGGGRCTVHDEPRRRGLRRLRAPLE